MLKKIIFIQKGDSGRMGLEMPEKRDLLFELCLQRLEKDKKKSYSIKQTDYRYSFKFTM